MFFDYVVEICEQIDRQTDRQTDKKHADCNTSHLHLGEVTKLNKTKIATNCVINLQATLQCSLKLRLGKGE